MNNPTGNTYVPGVCNIGPDEIRVRRKSTYFFGLVSLVLVGLIMALDLAHWWRLLVFFPVTGFAVTFQQTYFKFCVYFGMKGLFNFDKLGHMDSVQQAEMRKQDQAKAIKMLLLSVVIGAVVTAVFYLI